jgi:class 3 adenylate cyclase
MSDTAERLYEHALGLAPEARAAFLEDACSDEAQRAELASLLAHAEPAAQFFDGLIDPRIGRTVRHYRILAHLGSGGMGAVYRARDERLERDVALKFLPDHLATQREARERLLVEARAVAALQHPNVCVIHDIGETDDGRPFIAMALCDGKTLKERLDRGALAIDEAVAIAAQIARGLAAAHAHGIVHRDVKPANIMIAGDDTVKLLDFGLAKMADASITRPGLTPGTIAYMSPEQVRGDAVDLRTDLWSLGIVLYEMLARVRPFRGATDRVLAQAILHDVLPALSTYRPDVPEALVRIVERLLRKDAATRYASTGELLTDLAATQVPRTGPFPPNEAKRVDAVASYGIVDTPAESAYDELTELAARICGVPVAYIKFFDDTRAWFKSKVGLPPELAAVPREASVCNSTICQADLVVIPDCSADERVRDNPTVTGWPNVRFYCGMPLIDAEGYALGTFCIFDYVPRELGEEHRDLVRVLARQIVSRLELRRLAIRLERAQLERERAEHEVHAERARSRALLDGLLPPEVAEELRTTGRVRARHHASVTVLSAEFEDFARMARATEPARLLQTADEYFSAFDRITERYGLETVKTLGDWYVCVAGLSTSSRSRVVEVCRAAVAMQADTARINAARAASGLEPWRLRIGIHAGAAMAGVVGQRAARYDVWGDVVKIAQRVMAASAPGEVAVSGPLYERVRTAFAGTARGSIDVPNAGALPIYVLHPTDPPAAQHTPASDA